MVNRMSEINAGVFPRAAQIEITKERKRKYTKAMSQDGGRTTSLYCTGITVSDIEGVKFRHGKNSKYDRS